MATVTKTYVINLQLDQARAQLADATKKLEELAAQAEGIDKNSEAGKLLGGEMAKAAKQVESLTDQVEQLGSKITDAFAPGTIGALGKEAEDLEEKLKHALDGSQEAEELTAALGKVKARLKELDESTDSYFSRDRAGALVDAATGIASAFSIATVAAQNLGLSETDAEEYQQRLVEIISVVQSLEQIHRVFGAESRTAMKALYTEGKRVILGYLGIGEAATASGVAASTAGKVTKAALISTGIGVLIVLVGVLIANWDRLVDSVKGGEAVFTKVKAVASGLFSSMIAAIKQTGKLLGDLFTGNLPALVADAQSFGSEVGKAYTKGFNESVAESNKKFLEKQAEQYERYIQIIKAKGQDSYNVEVAALKKKIALQKAGSKEEEDLIGQLATLRAGRRKEEHDKELADVSAQLNAVASLQAAKGKDAFAEQLAMKEEELQQLLAAEIRNEAAITAKRSEIQSMRAAQAKKISDDEKAADLARLNARLSLEQAKGNEGLALQLRVKQKELEQLLSAEQKNAAAIITARQAVDAQLILIAQRAAEKKRAVLEQVQALELAQEAALGRDTLELRIKQAQQVLALDTDTSDKGLEQRKQDLQALKLLLIEQGKMEADLAQGRFETRQDMQSQELDDQANFNEGVAAGARSSIKGYAQIAAEAPTLGGTILKRMFGVADEDVEAVKQAISAAAGQLLSSLNDLGYSFLDASMQQVEKELEDAQQMYDEVDKKLSDATQKRQSAEDALKTASGARREYLIGRINAERAAEEKLARQKEQAAARQEKAEKEKHRLERISQELSAASTLATNAATAAAAVYAAVQAVKKGSENPFPLNLVAIATGLAAVIAAVASAKNLKTATKYRDGVTGIAVGPSHEQGGIQLWHKSGAHLGEMEGGEAITPTDATRKNAAALELIRTVGRTRTLLPEDFAQAASIRVVPRPTRHYADGVTGLAVPTGQTSAGDSAATVASVGALEAKLERTNALLLEVAAYTGTIASFGPARLGIGQPEALGILDLAQSGKDIQQANSL